MLTEQEAALIKGMLARGDKQHDIAARFGVNGGRIAEINTGKRFASVAPASSSSLPKAGPLIDHIEPKQVSFDNLPIAAALEANTLAIEKLLNKLDRLDE